MLVLFRHHTDQESVHAMSIPPFEQPSGLRRMPGRVVGASVVSGGEPPYEETMEARLKKREDTADKTDHRLSAIERDVAVVRSNYATEAILQSTIGAQTWKLVSFVCGFGTALVAATYFIATNFRA